MNFHFIIPLFPAFCQPQFAGKGEVGQGIWKFFAEKEVYKDLVQ